MTTPLPPSGMVLPRFAGLATFMRLPHRPPEAADAIDIGLLGVPFDGATTNRPGARHGPRQLRDQSTLLRHVNAATGVAPFRLARCADLGDCPVNPVNVEDTLRRIETFFRGLCERGIVPLAAGGDHLISLPILRALARTPLGLVHFDSHTDTWDRYFGGERFTHGTPFRRAIEEGLLDPRRVVQIGIRGTLFDLADLDWGREQGVRVISIDEWRELGPERALEEVRHVIGTGPAYLSFDIDVIDPAFAPGTGTPEIGGMFPHEAQRMLRGLRGLDLVGADLVEVSPPFDAAGQTALVGASLMFEILCLLAERVAACRAHGHVRS